MYKKFKNKYFFKKIFSIFLIVLFTSSFFFFFDSGELNAVTLQELANKISELSSQEQLLLEEIISAETNIEQKELEIAQLQEKLDIFEIELIDLYKQKIESEKKIASIKNRINKNAVKSYKYASDDVARLVISARSLNEAATVIFIYRRMIREGILLINELKDEELRFEMAFRKTEDTKNKTQELKETITKENIVLGNYLQERQDLLAQVKNEKSDFNTLLAQIKERIRQIQPPGLVLTGEWDMSATAYFSGGGGINGNGITAIGLRAKKGIVAVDPRVIPLGTRLFIPGYGEALAADTGGWIKGNRIDLVFESLEECFRFGRRKIRVYLVQ